MLFKRLKSDTIPSKSPPQHRRQNLRFPPEIAIDLSPEVFLRQTGSFMLFSAPKAHATAGNPSPPLPLEEGETRISTDTKSPKRGYIP